MAKTIKKGKWRDDTARIIAEIHGVTPRYVIMVRNGERENEEVFASLIDYQQGKSKLIQTIKELVQIEPQPEKYAR